MNIISDGQQYGTGADDAGAYLYGAETYGDTSGSYKPGTGADDAGAYLYGAETYGDTSGSYKPSFTSAAAPGKISFTLGDTGYQTDSKIVSGGQQHGTKGYAAGAYDTGAYDAGAYDTGAYDAGAYNTGAYDAGTYNTGAYDAGTYGTGSYGTGAYGRTRAGYRSGYSSGAAPGKISFTLGGTSYETGPSVGSGYGNVKSPALSKPYGMHRQRTSSIRTQGSRGGIAPGRISFTQDFSRVSGQSLGIQRSAGISGISTAKKTVAPVAVVTDEFPKAVAGNIGSSIGGGAYGAGAVPGSDFEEISGIGGLNDGSDYTDGGVSAPVSPAVPRPSTGSTAAIRTVHKTVSQPQTTTFTQDFPKAPGQSAVSAIKPAVHTYEKINAPVRTVVAPKRPYVNREAYRSGLNQGIRTTGALPQISFTQDFSKVRGQSNIVPSKPQIQSFDGISYPVRPIVAPKITSGSYGQTGIIRNTGFLGSTGTQPRISFTQDFSKIRGQSQQYGGKPRVQSFNRVSPAVVAPVVGPVQQHPVGHVADYIQKTEVHGITGVGEHGGVHDLSSGTVGVSGVHGSTSGFRPASVSSFDKLSTGGVSAGTVGVGVSGVHGSTSGFRPASVSSFDKLSTGGVSAVSRTRQSYGNRYGSGLRRPSQSVSGAGPAKISFIQDFSRVSGQQTSGIKPAISTRNEIPAFPAVITSPVAPKPAVKPEKLVFKAPKQPVTIVQQPAFTTVYDQSPVQEISAAPVSTGFVREHVADYKQEITNVDGYGGNKFSEIAYAPQPQAVFDKSSSYGQSGLTSGLGNVASSYKFTSAGRVGDKSNIYVAVPVDTKSEHVNSAGVVPAGGFAEEKESYYQITSGNVSPAVPSLAGQGQVGYSAVSTPFKSYYSSSYPGYSHVSGESPRFDFAHDKSLLYSSPYVSSPFSYTYTSEKGQSDQVYGKSIA